MSQGSFLSEDQFTCSICLDVFTNPSSTPCGHSFCMACITNYWNGTKVCQCPLCKKTFQKRPDLQINRTLREITDQFKSMSVAPPVKPKRAVNGVPKPDNLMKELKKKLPKPLPRDVTNLANEAQTQAFSYPGESSSSLYPPVSAPLGSSVPDQMASASPGKGFGHHLQPYGLASGSNRRRFTLSGVADSKNVPLCDIHNLGIVLYCRSDQVCICPECEIEDHNDHDTVSVETEWNENKAQLRDSEQQIQEMIRERQMKIEEIKFEVTELDMAVERHTAGSVCLFSKMTSAIERCQAELMEVMDINRRVAGHQADAMIQQLKLEIEDLQRRESELTALAQSDDHVHCVKTYPGLALPPVTKNWSGVSLNADLGTAPVYRSLAAMMERFQEELKSAIETGFPASVVEHSPVRSHPKVKKIQEYALDITLDSNTAHPRLVLSDDLKSVWCGDRHQYVHDNPERFDRVVCVLGRQAISFGKHYWEVEVNGKTDWDLGVARQSVNRKGKIDYVPKNGFWFLSLRDKNKYAFRSEPCTDVQLNLRPHKIGIFVDYEKGEVSFYNVDAKAHIYSFHDLFTEQIYPFFSPCTNKSGKNDMPLIITPVNMTD